MCISGKAQSPGKRSSQGQRYPDWKMKVYPSFLEIFQRKLTFIKIIFRYSRRILFALLLQWELIITIITWSTALSSGINGVTTLCSSHAESRNLRFRGISGSMILRLLLRKLKCESQPMPTLISSMTLPVEQEYQWTDR